MTAAALIKTHVSFINLGHQVQLLYTTPWSLLIALVSHSGETWLLVQISQYRYYILKI